MCPAQSAGTPVLDSSPESAYVAVVEQLRARLQGAARQGQAESFA
jgi:hypothetical protein